ncbi:hypothetical protein [Sciscionella sediminilitoris]|uniref:hypothetical protein n=1 Tax=Sciscionella sediminilitoris TaxID=1445613 RepID=UPI0004DEE158|nr:hypothetical protein [Sciscionella sp. SE31]
MIAASTLYLGAPGRMREIPPPEPGWSPKYLRFGTITRGLDGTGTEWLLGTKHGTSITVAHCDPEELRWIGLCWTGAVSPLWLLCSVIPNRFPVGVADTGSTLRGERALRTDGALNVIPDPAGFAEAPPMAVQVTGATLVEHAGLPVMPGETLTAAAWVHATAAVTARLRILDTTGAMLAEHTSAPAPSGDAYQRITCAGLVPETAATMTYQLGTASAATITTTAWSVRPDGSSNWATGGGAMRVGFAERSATTPIYPRVSTTIELEEL